MADADKCGCLTPEKKDLVAGILDIYAGVLDDNERINDINKLGSEIKECKCPVSVSNNKKEKKKRAPTARSNFMGYCMRGAAKGGEGKPMSECSTDWKELPKELRDTYLEED